ncbi:dihydrofolate reductase family protein [Flavobacterium sp. NRK1]|uniref:dihydrofolate reductase family protein n=1 Tax=Flavobacterium sp. NRK1 TaxID=2954929 RepID=UPI0020923F83|nr:dihydrofolate reductase family protein [Flavobacterium sp. NRK1]MCO6147243.1 dihydrofolate reductase family protein [Flavobacterium sp. NRK1]
MRKLTVFNFITLNGFYKGPDNDISWHRHGTEEAEYSEKSLRSDNMLLFGRITYEMMASWWPTPMAAEAYPEVAKGMNNAEKIVFSSIIEDPKWNNTKVISENIVEQIRELKKQPGKDMTILGSGCIVSQFAEAGLIDEYQIMIDPVVLCSGTPIFNDMKQGMVLTLTNSKIFKSGTALLIYKPGK